MTAPALILQGPDAREEFRRWSLAAAIVCAAHFGLMAGYLLMPAAGARRRGGVAGRAGRSRAGAGRAGLARRYRAGPDMLEAQPTPKPPEQVEPQVVEPMPRIEAPAEVTLPLPEPKAVEKKPEENPDKQKSETTPVQENTPAPQTTAAPRSEQHTAATPQAPSPGSAASRAAIASWRDLVLARLQQSKRYPASAEARHEQGVVTLSFSVDRNGRVLSRSIVEELRRRRRSTRRCWRWSSAPQPLPAFPPAMTQRVGQSVGADSLLAALKRAIPSTARALRVELITGVTTDAIPVTVAGSGLELCTVTALSSERRHHVSTARQDSLEEHAGGGHDDSDVEPAPAAGDGGLGRRGDRPRWHRAALSEPRRGPAGHHPRHPVGRRVARTRGWSGRAPTGRRA